ncbi:MAG: hypothetical protein ACI4UN_05555 [Muribaculaceae bacterium]
MIKCDVTVRGTVSDDGKNRNNYEGRPFFTTTLDVVIPDKNGVGKTVQVNVIKDGFVPLFDAPTKGSRVELRGALLIRRRDNYFVFQIATDEWKLDGVPEDDVIIGSMDFRGKVGKTIEEKSDKRGKPYLRFSAFSAEKMKDGFEYTWVSFLQFDAASPEWLKPSVRIEAKGTLDLNLYNGVLGLTCRVSSLNEYVAPNE